MYIESFRIDGFGIFSGVQVEMSVAGARPFFWAAMKRANPPAWNSCAPCSQATPIPAAAARPSAAMRLCAAARPGGSLVLRADEREPLHLTRRPGSGGGMLTLSEADGGMLPPELLRQLLFGVSREVYRNVSRIQPERTGEL